MPFPAHEIKHRRAVKFLELRQIEQRPQIARDRGLHELIQICKMPLKQFAGDANGDVRNV